MNIKILKNALNSFYDINRFFESSNNSYDH